MTLNEWGAALFGFVIGWITYRTVRRSQNTGISDIATVIGAVGGGAVTALFPVDGRTFGAYGIGLAVGFILYFATAVALASQSSDGISKVDEWLGTSKSPASGGDGNLPAGGPKIPRI